MSVSEPIRIDATGTFCPVPIIELGKALRTLASGVSVELLATDPGAEPDVRAYCRATGHRLESLVWEGKNLVATILRK